jgi:nucleotide-binding universal stress UspA family protein
LKFESTTINKNIKMKILFPTDFSKTATHASQYASVLAKQMNAEIVFLHIFSVPLISEYNLPHEIENFIMQNRIEATK